MLDSFYKEKMMKDIKSVLVENINSLSNVLKMSDGELLDVFLWYSPIETLTSVNTKLLEYVNEKREEN